jgi:hypothetical protein
MWHRFLAKAQREDGGLFAQATSEPRLEFGEPPTIALATRVPEDVWGSQKKVADVEGDQELMNFG